MSGIHTGVHKGTRVKILFKDGRNPIVTKFLDEKGRVIHTEFGKIQIKDMRAMMIHKSTNDRGKTDKKV